MPLEEESLRLKDESIDSHTITNEDGSGSTKTTTEEGILPKDPTDHSPHSNTWSIEESYTLDDEGKLPAYIDFEIINKRLQETDSEERTKLENILDGESTI